jgi:hypothetical protein
MMNKQFAELQVYPIGGGIAFGLPGTTTPFLALPSGQATIKPWGTSGFLFENILTGDVIAFVSEYDDVLDNTDAPYAGDQQTVFIALAAFFFDVAGGGAGDLASVLANGNESGTSNIEFDAGYGIVLDNNSRLQEGTIDAGLGGLKGIAEICGLGYESKWEGGVRYIMGSSGNTIRQSLYNFLNTPTAAEDSTKGYQIGSLWTLDNGDTYVCSDATTGAAVWAIQEYDFIGFDTAAAHTVAEGELAWNDTEGTLNLGLKGGDTISNLGQHLHARVVNKTTPLVNLTKAGYEVVVVSGATGQRLSVKKAKADNDANSAGTLGIVCEDIAGNQEGFICSVGQVTNINTTGSLQGETWADGDSLYLRGTTAGAITNVKPTAPIHEVRIGYVEYAHNVNGKIYVKIDNGYELDELHNVSINAGTLANKDILVYESGTQLWKNEKQPVEIQLAASDETTALTTGTAKMTFRMPHAMTLTAVRASLTTAQASGSIFTVDINESGATILSTKLTIDNTEKTSTTAATPAVISDTALADDAEITIDIDQIGDGTAKGLKLTLIGTR